MSAPANDNFADAITLTCGEPLAFDNTDATAEASEPTDCNTDIANGIWYRFTPTVTATFLISTGGSSFDTVLDVFTGGSVGALTPVECSDDYFGVQAALTAVLTQGTTYQIRVSGYGGAEQGAGVLAVLGMPVAPVVIASHADYDDADTTGSHTFDLVSGIAAGELLVLFWSGAGDSPVGTGYSPDLPSGYTLLRAASDGVVSTSISLNSRVWSKIADGGEGSTITITTTGNQASVQSLVSVRISPGGADVIHNIVSDTFAPPGQDFGDAETRGVLVLAAAHVADAGTANVLSAGSGYSLLEQVVGTVASSGTATYSRTALEAKTLALSGPGATINPAAFTGGSTSTDGVASSMVAIGAVATCPVCTDPPTFAGARIDRTTIDSGGYIETVQPTGAIVGDREIVLLTAYGWDYSWNSHQSEDPKWTPPDGSWTPLASLDGIPGKIAEALYSFGGAGYHDTWVYGWVKDSLGSADGFSFPDTLAWTSDAGGGSSTWTTIVQTQAFHDGVVDIQAPLVDYDTQASGFDSSAAGIDTALAPPTEATWVMTSLAAMVRLHETATGSTAPTVTWTTVDGPNGGLAFQLSGSSLDSPTFGWGVRSGNSGPTCLTVTEYKISSTDLGVKLVETDPTGGYDTGAAFVRCQWLRNECPAGSYGYWGVLVQAP